MTLTNTLQTGLSCPSNVAPGILWFRGQTIGWDRISAAKVFVGRPIVRAAFQWPRTQCFVRLRC